MQVQREGKDVTLVAFGKLVGYNLKAAEILEKEGISCEVSEHAGQGLDVIASCLGHIIQAFYVGCKTYKGHIIHNSVSCRCELLCSPQQYH